MLDGCLTFDALTQPGSRVASRCVRCVAVNLPCWCAGSAGGGSMAVQMGPRGAMPAIPGVLQAQQGPPGPMTALLQQEGPPPGLHPASGSMATPGASEVGYCSLLPAYLCAQQCICTIDAESLPH